MFSFATTRAKRDIEPSLQISGSQEETRAQNRTTSRAKRTANFFIWPAALVITVVTLVPLLYSFYVSFTGWVLTIPGSERSFVGLANYIGAISNADFWHCIGLTATYASLSTLIELILGLAAALMLNETFIGRGVVRTLLLIPLVITPAVVGMFWKLLYDDQQGVLNFFLVSMGLPPVKWLSHGVALTSVIITDVWQSTPFLMLIFLAGLQTMNTEMIGAAKIDGANHVQLFRFLTLPHLMPYILIGVFFRVLDASKDFDKIYLLTQGGPGNETTTSSILVYDTGFKVFQIARTSAMGWLVALITLVFCLPFLWVLSRRISHG